MDNKKCVSCYKERQNDKFMMCFKCNQLKKDTKLVMCKGTTKEQQPCKILTVNEYCLFHKKRSYTKPVYKDMNSSDDEQSIIQNNTK